MKLSQLKENTGVDPSAWISEHAQQKIQPHDINNATDGIIFNDSLNLLKVKGEIPFKFKLVSGTFGIHSSALTSLKNFPETIKGNCLVIGQSLTSLEHCPKNIFGSFSVKGNKLTAIDYFPEHVGGVINLSENKIKTLKGIHKKILSVERSLFLDDNPIEESILGLLLIKGLTHKNVSWGALGGNSVSDDLKRALEIMKPYYGGGKSAVMECQEKLIDAGLDDFADV